MGDRLDTDSVSAKAFGCLAVLVLTGISTRAEAEASQGLERPDVILPDLTGLIPVLERRKGYALRRRSRARTGTS